MRTSKHEQARYGWLRPSAAAKEVGVSQETIRELIRQGEIEAHDFRTGSRHEYRIPLDAWARFKDSRKVHPKETEAA